MTNTIVPTPTITATNPVLPQGTPGITIVIAYPNPVLSGSSGINFYVQLSGNAARIGIKIYTVAYRKVLEDSSKWEQGITYPDCRLNLAAQYISGLSNGIYYCILTADFTGGKHIVSKPYIIEIIK